MGFPNLTEEILSQANEGAPYFTICTDIKFGAEKMFYDLYFLNDLQLNHLILDKINATHLASIRIEDLTINGVNSRTVDKKLEELDWQKNSNKYPNKDPENYKKVLNNLWKLSFNDNTRGHKIMDRLICKHLPRAQWSPSVIQLSREYISDTWEVFDFAAWNTHICFLQISGRYNDLIGQIIRLQLNINHDEILSQLGLNLLLNKPEFTLNCTYNNPEGKARITIPVEITDELTRINDYSVLYTPYPEINHEVNNPIDTKALEYQMAQIDWMDEKALFIFDETEPPEIKPNVALIHDTLFQLTKYKETSQISDLLQIKYLQGSTFFDDLIPQSSWDLLDTLPVRSVKFPPDLPVNISINLSAGKFVFLNQESILPSKSSKWIRYNFDASNKNTSVQFINHYPPFQLEQQLRMVIPTKSLANVKWHLLQGDTVKTVSITGTSINIKADPSNQTLLISDSHDRSIPFNFNLEVEAKHRKKALEPIVKTPQNHTFYEEGLNKYRKKRGTIYKK